MSALTKDEQLKSWQMDYKDFLIDASPEILWFYVYAQGDYQGNVDAIGVYKNLIVFFSGYYGSCSGCGAWGEGGEPTDLLEVFDNSILINVGEKAPARFQQAAADSDLGKAEAEARAWVRGLKR